LAEVVGLEPRCTKERNLPNFLAVIRAVPESFALETLPRDENTLPSWQFVYYKLKQSVSVWRSGAGELPPIEIVAPGARRAQREIGPTASSYARQRL
jgi:hypothetical protein